MKERSYAYVPLSELDTLPRDGYFIIDDALYHIIDREVSDSWEITGKTVNSKIHSARKEAGLAGRQTIYVDDIGCFNRDVIDDAERLITSEEAYEEMDAHERDGWNDLAEYWQNH